MSGANITGTAYSGRWNTRVTSAAEPNVAAASSAHSRSSALFW